MPCDTVYTTSVMDLGKLDRGVLARALTDAGWVVATNTTGLTATRGGARLTVDGQSASVRTSNYGQSAASIETQIRQSYGRVAAVQTASKFGFKLKGETRLEGGAIKLTLGRTMGGPSKLGKVGL